jgi:uncharacterized protein (DUF427 family)
MKAIWRNTVIAESDDTIEVEGSVYFPPDSIRQELLEPGERTSYCPWKGRARYYSIHVDGEVNNNAAWCYREPRTYAMSIRDYMAFWHGVELVD